jgi:hypothetical protein
MEQSNERRHARRVPLNYEAELRQPGREQAFRGRIVDLSADGIALETDHPCYPGDYLEVRIQPPVGTTIPALRAIVGVVRSKPGRNGSHQVAGPLKRMPSQITH